MEVSQGLFDLCSSVPVDAISMWFLWQNLLQNARWKITMSQRVTHRFEHVTLRPLGFSKPVTHLAQRHVSLQLAINVWEQTTVRSQQWCCHGDCLETHYHWRCKWFTGSGMGCDGREWEGWFNIPKEGQARITHNINKHIRFLYDKQRFRLTVYI